MPVVGIPGLFGKLIILKVGIPVLFGKLIILKVGIPGLFGKFIILKVGIPALFYVSLLFLKLAYLAFLVINYS